ncbi:MAG: hypothetical protein N4A74_24120 [Carboxylicivirga sp.]|jgi:hypothetical protein|nr:hypothetical protein [Carboxylicivirga sp.]
MVKQFYIVLLLLMNIGVSANSQTNSTKEPSNINESQFLLPDDLPKEFFGNWYDKYGTLKLITTPDFIVTNIRVWKYYHIEAIDGGRYRMVFSEGSRKTSIDVLKLDGQTMVFRNDHLEKLYRKEVQTNIPEFVKGKWQGGDSEIEVFNTSFAFKGSVVDNHIFRANKLALVHVAESKNKEMYWFILQNEGNYHIYIAQKKDEEFELSSYGRGYLPFKKKQ